MARLCSAARRADSLDVMIALPFRDSGQKVSLIGPSVEVQECANIFMREPQGKCQAPRRLELRQVLTLTCLEPIKPQGRVNQRYLR